MLDEERPGAGNDRDIEAEQQASQRRRGGQEDDIGHVDFAGHGRDERNTIAGRGTMRS